jgi:DNA-3-methyladenine glycosylase II
VLKHGERWRPYRSIGAWYMWRAIELARQADQ